MHVIALNFRGDNTVHYNILWISVNEAFLSCKADETASLDYRFLSNVVYAWQWPLFKFAFLEKLKMV